jgi:hypothetical protein
VVFAQSLLVSAIALAGAASLSVVVTATWLALSDVARSSVPIDGRALRAAVGRLYWGSLSPLVHTPVRRFVLQASVALLIVIAPAIRLAW